MRCYNVACSIDGQGDPDHLCVSDGGNLRQRIITRDVAVYRRRCVCWVLRYLLKYESGAFGATRPAQAPDPAAFEEAGWHHRGGLAHVVASDCAGLRPGPDPCELPIGQSSRGFDQV
jgi:hypothetical protein